MTTHKQSDLDKKISRAIHLVRQGKTDEAIDVFHSILPVAATEADSLAQFGTLCLLLNKPIEAIEAYSQALTHQKDNATYLGQLGTAYLANQQLKKAEYFLLEAYRLGNNDPEILNYLGQTEIALGNYSLAKEVFEKLLAIKPGTPSLYRNLAVCCMECNQTNKALDHALKATKAEPLDANGHFLAGKILLDLGEFDSGAQLLKKTIRLDPAYGAAYQHIALTKKFSEQDRSFITQTEQALDRNLSPSHRASIHYALGKIYDDINKPQIAFSHFKKANILSKPAIKPIPPWQEFKQLKKLFVNLPLKELAQFGSGSRQPIFIIGTPRSGTTLVEKILSSHSQITGAGELKQIGNIADNLPLPTQHYRKKPEEWSAFFSNSQPYIQQYLSILQEGNSAAHIIDKQPGNYYYLGLISLLFPEAKIIHTVRNPLDACLSCYFQNFQEVAWSKDLQWIGEHYLFYRKVMGFWESVIPPERIIHVSYENLINDPETQSQRLVKFIGVDWEPACLDFYKQKHSVKTASLWQVQQPIYKSSQGRWRPYITELGGLAQLIAPYIDLQDKALFAASGISIEKNIWHKLLSFVKLRP